jgi:hypothetical protein
VICVHGSPVDTVAVVHSREKTARPREGEGQEMERGSCFFPSDSRCLRRTWLGWWLVWGSYSFSFV